MEQYSSSSRAPDDSHLSPRPSEELRQSDDESIRRPTRVIPKGTWVGSHLEIVCRLPQTGGEKTYVARDHQNRGESVLLQLLPLFRARSGFPRESLIQQVARVRRLKSPGLLPVRDLILDPEQILVSDYMEGLSLARLLGGPMSEEMAPSGMPVPKAIELVGRLATVIDFLHSQSTFHGDLRAESILVCRTRSGDLPKIMDLALSGPGLTTNPDFDGQMCLHPCRAPEWLRGDPVGCPADIYGLAALSYWMISGRPPFEGPYLVEKILGQLAAPIVRIPHAANQVLLKGLERVPGERYPSASLFSQDLARALQGLLPNPSGVEIEGLRGQPSWMNSLQQTFWSLALFLIGFLGLLYLFRYF